MLKENSVDEMELDEKIQSFHYTWKYIPYYIMY